MKSKLTKLLALLMAAAIVFSLAACGKESSNETTAPANTTENATQANADVDTSSTEAVSGTEANTTDITGTDITGTATTNKDSGSSPTAAPPVTTKMPVTKAEILAAYTTVMNYAKSAKPAYKKIEYQALPNDKINMENKFVGKILDQADRFMTTKDEAKTESSAKGSDMKWFPVYKATKGCLLTNVNAIKTASCVKLSNGNYKMTFVLKNEINPEPYSSGAKAPSNVGAIFDPIATSDINDTLKNDSKVKLLVSNVKYELTYQNCTAILEYNPKTNQIVKLDQYMNTFINIQSGKVLFLSLKGTAELNNTLSIWDVKY